MKLWSVKCKFEGEWILVSQNDPLFFWHPKCLRVLSGCPDKLVLWDGQRSRT
ncbi:hypothetical protein Plhal304r1_c015g0056001 [Plasmopara halstedii]